MKNKLFVFIYIFIFALPIVFLSNEVARDRIYYLEYIGNPDAAYRMEFLFQYIILLLSLLGHPNYSILLIPFFIIFLIIRTQSLLTTRNSIFSLLMYFCLINIYFFSIIGVQIRFGLALVLIVYLYVLLIEADLKKITKITFFLLPIGIHYGVAAFSIIAILSLFFNRISLLFLLCLSFLSYLIIQIFQSFDGVIDIYYIQYLDGSFKGEKFTLSFLTYSIIFVITKVNKNFKIQNKKFEFMTNIGYYINLMGFMSEFFVLFKFGYPFFFLAISLTFWSFLRHVDKNIASLTFILLLPAAILIPFYQVSLI